jgi:hypothetical protein
MGAMTPDWNTRTGYLGKKPVSSISLKWSGMQGHRREKGEPLQLLGLQLPKRALS